MIPYLAAFCLVGLALLFVAGDMLRELVRLWNKPPQTTQEVPQKDPDLQRLAWIHMREIAISNIPKLAAIAQADPSEAHLLSYGYGLGVLEYLDALIAGETVRAACVERAQERLLERITALQQQRPFDLTPDVYDARLAVARARLN